MRTLSTSRARALRTVEQRTRASLELTDDSGTLDVPLSGVGITGQLSATPNAIDFPPQPPSGGAKQLGVSIQDSPTAGVQAISATITGPDAAQYYIAGGQYCTTQSYVPSSSAAATNTSG